ncbi:MAG: hypothetical protein ACYDAE_16810 [Steroidobacteraceae bacterium]
MNTFSETRSNTEKDQVETAPQESETASMSEPQLVKLGKVSDTQGGWLGVKLDVGAGFITY